MGWHRAHSDLAWRPGSQVERMNRKLNRVPDSESADDTCNATLTLTPQRLSRRSVLAPALLTEPLKVGLSILKSRVMKALLTFFFAASWKFITRASFLFGTAS